MIMKVKLNKTIRTISLSMGLLLFSAIIFAQQPYGVVGDTTETQVMATNDSLIVDMELALSIAIDRKSVV